MFYCLNILKKLSLTFQRENLILSQINVHMKKVFNSLNELKKEVAQWRKSLFPAQLWMEFTVIYT